MQPDEAKFLLGFPPHSHPSPSQVKAAYKSKALDTHPDRFPPHQKSSAEHRFKMISEAYTCLRSEPAAYSRVVRTGVPRAYGGRGNSALVGIPFLFIIVGAVTLGGSNAFRAYKRQKEAYPSHNPFLP